MRIGLERGQSRCQSNKIFMLYIPFASSISRCISYTTTVLHPGIAGNRTFCLEAEDLVLQLGKSPGSGVSDLSKVDPVRQRYVLITAR
jgi:hypothetical protein